MKGLGSLALKLTLATVVLGSLGFVTLSIFTNGITDLGNTNESTEEVRCDYQREEVLDPSNNIGSDDLIGCEVDAEIEAQAERTEIRAGAIETLNGNATCGKAYPAGELLTQNITCAEHEGKLTRIHCAPELQNEDVKGVTYQTGDTAGGYVCSEPLSGYNVWTGNPFEGNNPIQ